MRRLLFLSLLYSLNLNSMHYARSAPTLPYTQFLFKYTYLPYDEMVLEALNKAEQCHRDELEQDATEYRIIIEDALSHATSQPNGAKEYQGIFKYRKLMVLAFIDQVVSQRITVKPDLEIRGDPHIVVKTRCNHLFHQSCIFSWLKGPKAKPCPLCRVDIEEKELLEIKITEGSTPCSICQTDITPDSDEAASA